MQSEAPVRMHAARLVRLISWILFLVLVPVMILSLSIIVQSARQPDKLPVIFGHKALILLPDAAGEPRALGIIQDVAVEALKPHDRVAYKENDVYYVEPVRQVDVQQSRVALQAGSGLDEQSAQTQVAASQIEGILVHRIPRIGSWALFMQTPTGMMLFLVLPCLAFLLTDALRRNRPDVPALETPAGSLHGA